jgi:DNA-binding CsgD family transcriptional regulator
MLQRPGTLASIGAVAASNHERLDGSGYHRQASGNAIAPLGRILAAADAYHAMTEDRPHRRALPRDDAARTLRDEARAGRFDRDAAERVLAAAGHRATRTSRPRPADLTARELEVLLLIARGATTRQVAKALGITPKTAGNHIERLYTKTGCTSRAAAALYAMQAGLLDSLDPYDPLEADADH